MQIGLVHFPGDREGIALRDSDISGWTIRTGSGGPMAIESDERLREVQAREQMAGLQREGENDRAPSMGGSSRSGRRGGFLKRLEHRQVRVSVGDRELVPAGPIRMATHVHGIWVHVFVPMLVEGEERMVQKVAFLPADQGLLKNFEGIQCDGDFETRPYCGAV